MQKKETNGAQFFSNHSCPYYPCHSMEEELNCLFCFCPLYPLRADCPGVFTRLLEGGKDCSQCTFPHKRENYEQIIALLHREQGRFSLEEQ